MKWHWIKGMTQCFLCEISQPQKAFRGDVSKTIEAQLCTSESIEDEIMVGGDCKLDQEDENQSLGKHGLCHAKAAKLASHVLFICEDHVIYFFF